MKYAVAMRVHGTAFVHVEADNPQLAMERANDEFCEGAIPICHQCSSEISDPSYGPALEATLLDG